MGEPESDNRWRGMLTGDEEATPAPAPVPAVDG
jgi:hypothetical protein